jgi:dienelactone hydrolase
MPADPVEDPREPLSPFYGPDEAREGIRVTRFEYSSAGDRVHGILWRPEGSEACPLVLVAHARDGSKDAPELDALGRTWTRAGAAVAAIDLPLHGGRASGKLGERVLRAVGARAATDALDADLWRHVVHQATTDFARALTLLADRPGVDASRLAFAGFGLGAQLGAALSADDTRLCTAVLAGPAGSAAAGPRVSVLPLDSDEISPATVDDAWRLLAPGLGLAPR